MPILPVSDVPPFCYTMSQATMAVCLQNMRRLLSPYMHKEKSTRNQQKTEFPSSPPQYFLSTRSEVPSIAFPTICRESNLGLPNHQRQFLIKK